VTELVIVDASWHAGPAFNGDGRAVVAAVHGCGRLLHRYELCNIGSSQEAELYAIEHGLEAAREHGWYGVTVWTDNRACARALASDVELPERGMWLTLRRPLTRARALTAELAAEVVWVEREHVAVAHRACR
jgi:ribonuclease HI